MDIYVATDSEQKLAAEWHSGQYSMLYAVASTGALSLGTIRPTWGDGTPMDDSEWASHLRLRLLCELEGVVRDADRNGLETDGTIAAIWWGKL